MKWPHAVLRTVTNLEKGVCITNVCYPSLSFYAQMSPLKTYAGNLNEGKCPFVMHTFFWRTFFWQVCDVFENINIRLVLMPAVKAMDQGGIEKLFLINFLATLQHETLTHKAFNLTTA